jgi:hypothetical protein
VGHADHRADPREPRDAIYGAIAVGALLAAETPRRETYAMTVAAAIITLLLHWLAHSYPTWLENGCDRAPG